MVDHEGERSDTGADELLSRLEEGNQRFARGAPRLGATDPAFRTALACGQHPLAAVLACSDSRVSPELLFDQGLGRLFVVRVAGNVVDQTVLGSLEYAVEHLGVPLVVVMGHSSCGAVTSACTCSLDELEGATAAILRAIGPSVAATRATCRSPDELVDAAARLNVAAQTETISASPVMREAITSKRLTVRSAWYDLGSGVVSWL